MKRKTRFQPPSAHLSVRHVPRFVRDGGEELTVVADDDHAALELLDGRCQRAQRLAVEVVGGLVQNLEKLDSNTIGYCAMDVVSRKQSTKAPGASQCM